MKIDSWDTCIDTNCAKKVSIDYERAKSLIKTSKARLDLCDEITEKNCNFVFEDYYTSLLELI